MPLPPPLAYPSIAMPLERSKYTQHRAGLARLAASLSRCRKVLRGDAGRLSDYLRSLDRSAKDPMKILLLVVFGPEADGWNSRLIDIIPEALILAPLSSRFIATFFSAKPRTDFRSLPLTAI